jgi:hypothetical protein
MPAIGMILAWFGYSVSSWGYCLIRGYDVKFTDWINPAHPYQGWPPPQAPADQIIPGQNPGAPSGKTTSGVPETTNVKTGTVAGANPKIVGVAGRGR